MESDVYKCQTGSVLFRARALSLSGQFGRSSVFKSTLFVRDYNQHARKGAITNFAIVVNTSSDALAREPPDCLL